MRTSRSIARYLAAAGAVALATSTSPLSAQAPSPRSASKYLFAWTADSSRHASDFLAVIDADPASKSYGHIVASVPAGAMGTLPHHTEYEFPSDGILFANGWAASRSFIFDLRNPTAPKLLTSFKDVGPYAFPHSFVRLPNGHLLATAQGKGAAYAPPGGLVEVDERGTPIRWASAAGIGLVDTLTWPYSLAIDAKHDRVIVTNTSMPIPEWLHAPAGSWRKSRADSSITSEIEFWQLSNLKLLSVVKLPKPPKPLQASKTQSPGAVQFTAANFSAEPRLLPDGSMYVNTFMCGLYHITAIDSPTPHVAFVHEFPSTPDMPCAVPAIVGHYWIQTVAELPGLIALDISNPAHPVEVSRLMLDKKLGMPHWLASDANANRVVLTGDNQGWVMVINVDPRTGALAIDKNFRDERTGAIGVSLDGRRWPHGTVARAFVHGTLFGPR